MGQRELDGLKVRTEVWRRSVGEEGNWSLQWLEDGRRDHIWECFPTESVVCPHAQEKDLCRSTEEHREGGTVSICAARKQCGRFGCAGSGRTKWNSRFTPCNRVQQELKGHFPRLVSPVGAGSPVWCDLEKYHWMGICLPLPLDCVDFPYKKLLSKRITVILH